MNTKEKLHPVKEVEISTEDHQTVLVVDDDPIVCFALATTLKQEGYTVHSANSGQDALEIIQQVAPALIICDQNMPGISGTEVLEKAAVINPESIRILLTASHNPETAIDAINIGHVNQYFTKPWDDKELRKTVRVAINGYKLKKENLGLQKLIFNQHKQLKITNDNLQHDLKLGASIHEQLLLGNVPKDVPGLTIDAISLPSKGIDGDFFEFYRPTQNVLDLVIADVMGKGIAAALVGTAVKTQMIRFSMPFPSTQTFEKYAGWTNHLLTTNEILTNVHKELAQKLIDLEYFVSLFYGRFDLQYKTFSFVDCGSTKPIHFKAKEGTITELNGHNFPLGVTAKANYQTVETEFAKGDIFVFYSDGVTEARSPENAFFGVERLINIIQNNTDLTAHALKDLIRYAVLLYTKKDELDDDLTLIIVKIEKYNLAHTTQTTSVTFNTELTELEDVRSFVKQLCQNAPGNSERLSSEMQLAVNEAFCNIVKHGNVGDPKKIIKIEGELNTKEIAFKISDQGHSFDPSLVNTPSFSGAQDTGYGWHIMKEITDKICYTRKDTLQGWNHLCLYKRYYHGGNKLNIAHQTAGQVLIIIPEGDSLDARDAPFFKEQVIELINDSNSKGVVFDLNQLEFIDSSGLGSFLSVLRILNTRGSDLKLSRMNRPIRTMFELVKMHKIFEIFNSTEDAVRSFE